MKIAIQTLVAHIWLGLRELGAAIRMNGEVTRRRVRHHFG